MKEKGYHSLAYHDNNLAILDVEEIFNYNRLSFEQAVLGITDLKHPGVKMYNSSNIIKEI